MISTSACRIDEETMAGLQQQTADHGQGSTRYHQGSGDGESPLASHR